MPNDFPAELERVVRDAAERLLALPEADAEERPRPGKWSAKEARSRVDRPARS